ncbi:AraC family transcriptional regulator [Pleomorphovibrio marinus]|uniref:AraC family transcriptional regulator n=1 Tax=Pleomorphovibrio marinus TaxID=2164132 RepID=UPI000E0A86D5|nr:helix-turn-helix transcriptional regulator [Pleomorphovibrio marinus]
MYRPITMDTLHTNFGKCSPVEPFLVTDNIYPGTTQEIIRPQFYSISICLSGSYSVRIYEQEYQFRKGQVMFFKPNEMHRMLEIEDFKGYLISFSPDFFTLKNTNSVNAIRQPFFAEEAEPILALTEEEEKTVLNYFKAIHKKDSAIDTPHKMEIVKGLLHALLFELKAIFGKESSGSPRPISNRREYLFFEFTKLLNLYYGSEHSVRFYADQLHITPGYLGELVKAKTGVSPLVLIHKKILMEAKALLKNTDESIEQVSYLLNFNELAGFSRFFKKLTGISPAEFRDR